MKNITYTHDPIIRDTHIITPPIYVGERFDLPKVGELVKATCHRTGSVMIGEVLEVSSANRTYAVKLQRPPKGMMVS